MIRNTQKQIVDVLKDHPFLPETEIFRKAFGYNRSTSRVSNKKYAELLRRALRAGKIKRTEANPTKSRSKYFYYVPRLINKVEVVS